MTASWEAVAGAGAPQRVRAAIGLSCADEGRARLDAALASGEDLREVPVPADALAEADEHAACWAALDVRVVLRGDDGWPPRLARVAGPPPWLAVRGAPLPDGAAVAMVGARKATDYGRAVAGWLAESCAEAGVAVVSGGAVGIDAASHQGALGRGGVVVLGCGHDVRYPRRHAAPGGLFEQVLDGGGTVCSEQLPGRRAVPWAVRARNRIVAGLVDAVVVVEGGPRSGSLITASAAADAGVPVLAVPGDVRRPGSAAPHRLLAEGAAPCTQPADLLELLRQPMLPDTQAQARARPPGVLPAEVRTALAARWPSPITPAALADELGSPLPQLLAALVRGRVAGEVVDGADGIRLARAPG